MLSGSLENIRVITGPVLILMMNTVQSKYLNTASVKISFHVHHDLLKNYCTQYKNNNKSVRHVRGPYATMAKTTLINQQGKNNFIMVNGSLFFNTKSCIMMT